MINYIFKFMYVYCNEITLFSKVQPQHPDGTIIGDKQYVRTGLLGFLGPVSF